MALRTLFGQDSSGVVRIRQSKAGANAMSPGGLNDLLFDADYIPSRVAMSGESTVAAVDTGGNIGAPAFKTSTVNHNLGYVPIVAACAKNLDSVWYWTRGTTSFSGAPISDFIDMLQSPIMQGHYVTPWWALSSGVANGRPSTLWSGWFARVTSSQMILYNACKNAISVRWRLLEP